MRQGTHVRVGPHIGVVKEHLGSTGYQATDLNSEQEFTFLPSEAELLKDCWQTPQVIASNICAEFKLKIDVAAGYDNQVLPEFWT